MANVLHSSVLVCSFLMKVRIEVITKTQRHLVDFECYLSRSCRSIHPAIPIISRKAFKALLVPDLLSTFFWSMVSGSSNDFFETSRYTH